MNLFKKIFHKNSEETKLKNVLNTINKVNKVIANMENWQKEPPSKDIFIKALSEIEDIKERPSISTETKKSLENFQKTCVQAFASILHSEGIAPFKNGDYQKTFEILDSLRSLIVKHCEFFEIERARLIKFIEDMAKDFSGNPNEEINPKSLNPMRIKYQEKARKIFGNEITSTFIEMLVDALVISIVCKHMLKNNI